LTPLEGKTFIDGKLSGILDAVIPYYVAYAVPAFFLSLLGGGAAGFATVCGLAMAWPVIYYAPGGGLRCAAEGRTTWRALALALLWVYMLGSIVCFAITASVGTCCLCAAWGILSRLDKEVAAMLGLVLILGCMGGANALALCALGRNA